MPFLLIIVFVPPESNKTLKRQPESRLYIVLHLINVVGAYVSYFGVSVLGVGTLNIMDSMSWAYPGTLPRIPSYS